MSVSTNGEAEIVYLSEKLREDLLDHILWPKHQNSGLEA
jgi:hypothetical protein